jgi:hypothetical protein
MEELKKVKVMFGEIVALRGPTGSQETTTRGLV